MSDRHDRWTGQEMLFARSRKVRQRGTGMSEITDGLIANAQRIATLEAQREAMRAVLQSYINLLETIKSSRKGYVGDHTIYSVQLNESAIDSLYAQVKKVYEERG